MNKIYIILIILVVVGIFFFFFWQKRRLVTLPDVVTPMKTFILKSSAFENQANIPSKYTCDGEDINPPLEISDIPEESQSLALIVDDPDAPIGTFTHWLVWNMSSDITKIDEDSVPEGAVEGETDFGRIGWGGPCPPTGTHRYFFKMYALDTKLNLQRGATKSQLEKAMEGHILGKAELIGLYSRQ